MAIRSPNIDRNSHIGWKAISMPLGTTTVSQTAKLAFACTPGFGFAVAGVEVFALTVTATATIDVQIGSTSVLSAPITPVAATPTDGVLAASFPTLKGLATDTLSLLYTTNGTGAITGGTVTVWIRPSDQEGDPQ